ncbi:MAG: hypothetical protein U0169_27190, partial [Polyangiaceae bacterium]
SFVDQATVVTTPVGTTTIPNASIFAPAEWMASVRTAPFLEGDVSILASGGTSLGTDAITTPRYRFALGLRYAPTAKSGSKRAPVVLPPDVGGSR